MINFKRSKHEPTHLQTVIENHLSEMAGYDCHSEEYAAMATNLKTLVEAEAIADRPNTVSADTLVTVAGSLAGIIAILSFEHANVVTSKALSFVLKPKI